MSVHAHEMGAAGEVDGCILNTRDVLLNAAFCSCRVLNLTNAAGATNGAFQAVCGIDDII